MTRTDLLQSLIFKFRYKTYLEIGCQTDVNFSQIIVDHKVGVDPESGGTFRGTSDLFFEQNTEMFDIVFIDGLHISDQVDKDIANSLKCLNNGGIITLHDCNPPREDTQFQKMITTEWTGDVWKSFVKQRCLPNIDAATADFDYGCGVLRVRDNTDLISVDESLLTWDNLVENRQQWLRLMDYQDLIKWV